MFNLNKGVVRTDPIILLTLANTINPKDTKLFVMVDTDISDENRDTKTFSIPNPENLSYNLSFNGFDQIDKKYENTKHSFGWLCGTINLIVFDPDTNSETTYHLASPKLQVFPIKKATKKRKEVWTDLIEEKHKIVNQWSDVFKVALSDYHEQGIALLNKCNKSVGTSPTITNYQPSHQEAFYNSRLQSNQVNLPAIDSGFAKKAISIMMIFMFVGSYAVYNLKRQEQMNQQLNVANSPESIDAEIERTKQTLLSMGVNLDDNENNLGCLTE